jgi:NlpC/P60 family putative phage cell wall peptidase
MRVNAAATPPAGHAVIAEARRWVGTPFRHQAALRGVGCDCAGLIRGVGEACGVLRISPVMWACYANYARLPHPARMRKALEVFLRPVAHAGAAHLGDVLWMQWRPDLPMHLALVAERNGRPMLIHSTIDIGRVVEHELTVEWRSRIHSAWRYPGLAEAPGLTEEPPRGA